MGESKGELLIGEDSVFFVADEAITDANYTQVCLVHPLVCIDFLQKFWKPLLLYC